MVFHEVIHVYSDNTQRLKDFLNWAAVTHIIKFITFPIFHMRMYCLCIWMFIHGLSDFTCVVNVLIVHAILLSPVIRQKVH